MKIVCDQDQIEENDPIEPGALKAIWSCGNCDHWSTDGFCAHPTKKDYEILTDRHGFGVPNECPLEDY